MELVFASNNPHKIKEINSIIGSDFQLKGLNDFNIIEDIPENEPTLEGNALSKARFVHAITGKNVFADDTGLETEALGGLPGVHSARFAGDSKDSSANIAKLQLMLGNNPNRKARFRTVIALIFEGREYLFEGIVNGNIISDNRGTMGFGYDPVFVPEGKNMTFAEMDLSEKNTISHRARAFEKLRSFLEGVSRNEQ
jgi:XTP/dITP diphosphohydrolase